jgi:hypothetical protein
MMFLMIGIYFLASVLKISKVGASICQVAWCAIVYHIWIQRNNRIHAGEVKTEEQIVKAIKRDVKARMEASHISNSTILHKTICYNWRIQIISTES